MSNSSYGPEPTGGPAPRDGFSGPAQPGRRRRSAPGNDPRAVPGPPSSRDGYAERGPAAPPPDRGSYPPERGPAPPPPGRGARARQDGRPPEARQGDHDPGGRRAGPPPGGRREAPGRQPAPQGRRAEAAFEDTQAMMAAAAAAEAGARPPAGPGGPGGPGGGRRAARTARSSMEGGPGRPGGPDGPRGPRGPRRPGDDNPTDPGASGGGGGRRRRRAGGGDDDGDGGTGKTGWKRFIPSWKLVMAGAVVFAAGIFGMIAVAYANTPIPTVTQDTADDQGSVIYYDDGKGVIARLGTRRTPVTIDQIPVWVQDAVIAVENQSFREDNGIDFRSIARSVYSTVTGQQVQGASTITQQMVRNYYDGLSQEVSVTRKITEIFVAVKVDKSLSKDEILTRYLNTIYFGRSAYGIQAAAQAYFKKNVKDLSPEQGAYLAGRIQNPDRFDRLEEAGDMAATQERYSAAIKNMAEMNPEKYGSLPTKSPTMPKRVKWTRPDAYKGLNGYMITAVLDEMQKKYGIDKEEVEKGGYKITSTFNKRLMTAARDAVVNNTSGLSKEITTSLAAVDPRNGQVRAFYGGRNYLTDEWNQSTMSQKQAASAFKPYVLAAWLDSGYSLNSYLQGTGEVKLPGTTPIGNDHSGPASVDVIKATADSVNTAFATMAEKVGLDKVIDIASAAGLDRARLEDAEQRHHYLLSIGSNQVTALEQAAGYSIFANQGKHYETHVIKKVVTKEGLTQFKESDTFKQVISPDAAADSIVALQQVVKAGTGKAAALYDRPVAGKTGTNNENKEAWFVGFAPQLSTAVGMYREHKGAEVTLGDIQGATYPTKVWHAFMQEALKGAKVEQFPPRANVGMPENLAPSPAPTPTETETPIPPDDSGFPGDDWGPAEDVPVDPPTEESRECLPWDGSCEDPGMGDGGGGWGGNPPGTTSEFSTRGRDTDDG
ncbi:hypothetical protein Misp01_76010 [Microtetraspora sp. NBRC 13810]|uniref:transglycosylase domain-containing protein n=1 Tax=Microtetraspora sp. NBRC 13810 TaxID=3030990 RepID=UPI0024A1D509|nr:transglycosylase domain-containing protein [Microtetraspora sp. NBRC 13810]GLW12473.1 hypothetical protein Misp01_76010 [Microtetraspora sp. NBRC 13810]